MIAYQAADMKSFFTRELSPFSQIGNLVMIIVDPYFGGRNPYLRQNVEEFLDYVSTLAGAIRFVWFSNEYKCPPMSHSYVENLDLSRHGIEVHDRFLLLFDGTVKKYVYHFHLGGSINGIDWNGTDPLSLMRVSVLTQDEINELEVLIQQLESVYSHQTGKSNWGCLS